MDDISKGESRLKARSERGKNNEPEVENDDASDQDLMESGNAIPEYAESVTVGHSFQEPCFLTSQKVKKWCRAGGEVRNTLESFKQSFDRPEVRRVRNRASKTVADMQLAKTRCPRRHDFSCDL